jgi:hypothetical protein
LSHFASECVEIGYSSASRCMHHTWVHAGITVGYHIAKTHGSAQGRSGPRGDYTFIAQAIESTREVLSRRPPLVGDDMAGDVGAALDSEHQVEAHEIKRVAVGAQLVHGRRALAAGAQDAVLELQELRRQEIAVNHVTAPAHVRVPARPRASARTTACLSPAR